MVFILSTHKADSESSAKSIISFCIEYLLVLGSPVVCILSTHKADYEHSGKSIILCEWTMALEVESAI